MPATIRKGVLPAFPANSKGLIVAGAQRFGSGVPADALGNLGDRYFNTTAQRWYLKRWVANREGAGDSILFPINLFPSVGDFDFSVLIRRDSSPNNWFLVAAAIPNTGKVFNLTIDPGVPHKIVQISSAGGPQGELSSTAPVDSSWHSVGARRVGTTLSVTFDGVVTNSITSPAWTPSLTETGTLFFKSPLGDTGAMKACNIKFTGPGGSIIASLDEGAGTVITNRAGANGTLTDGAPTNFWAQAWVPLDLL